MVVLDVGLPLIEVGVFGLVVLLVPVVVVETVVVRRMTGIAWFKTAAAVGLANAVTTLLGFPLGWLFMRGVRAVTGKVFYGHSVFHFPWDEVFNSANYDTWLSMSMDWSTMLMVYSGSLLLLIPTFFISVWVETGICTAVLGKGVSRLPHAVRRANLVSYALLGVLLLALAANNLAHVKGWQAHGSLNQGGPERAKGAGR